MMLIPLRVDVPMYRRPIANYVILGLIVVCFGAQLANLGNPEAIAPYVLYGWNPLGLIGHMFLHGGLMHLIGNLLFLWIFGNAVCEKVGNIAYPFIFLGLGLMAAATHNLMSDHPAIGASGAINGIVGMFVVWFPMNLISCFYFFWIFLFIRWGTFEVSSYVMILLWLAFDILGAAIGMGGVAYWAHLGGFGAGAALALLLTKLEWVSIYDTERTVLDIFGLRKSWAERGGRHKAPQAAPPPPAAAPYSPPPPTRPEARPPQRLPQSNEQPPRVAPARASFVTFTCACGKTLRARPEQAGKRAKCPACGAIVLIPEREAE